VDGVGKLHKPQALKDPSSGAGVRDWNRAVELIRDMELPAPPEPDQKPQTSMASAVASFMDYKAHRSVDVRRKAKLILGRLKAFLEVRGKTTVPEVSFTDLVAFRAEWKDALTTQRRNQEVLRGFFKFCVRSEFIAKNPATDLDAIKEGRPKTEPFTREELARIFEATELLCDSYGRRGGPIAKQTKAFVYVMRYTGMSIGDTAKLVKDAVDGCRIRTYRKKTGEDVFARVPPFVIAALDEAPHDSDRYFFWSGQGKMHTRASKWGEHLQRLFVLAEVKTEVVRKVRRSGGKLKAEPETVKVSLAHPHMFRHTLARDLLEDGTTMAEIAELFGNSIAIVEKHYSKWDVRRQAKLERRLEHFWESDPLAVALSRSSDSPKLPGK
jgi:site-specific recombinase XerD